MVRAILAAECPKVISSPGGGFGGLPLLPALHVVTLGSGETACVMNTQLPDDRSLYIKLKMEDEMAVILSFHVNQHSP